VTGALIQSDLRKIIVLSKDGSIYRMSLESDNPKIELLASQSEHSGIAFDGHANGVIA
jgi:hypothetical protein